MAWATLSRGRARLRSALRPREPGPRWPLLTRRAGFCHRVRSWHDHFYARDGMPRSSLSFVTRRPRSQVDVSRALSRAESGRRPESAVYRSSLPGGGAPSWTRRGGDRRRRPLRLHSSRGGNLVSIDCCDRHVKGIVHGLARSLKFAKVRQPRDSGRTGRNLVGHLTARSSTGQNSAPACPEGPAYWISQ